MSTLRKNEIYMGEITSYSADGAGVARIDGQVVFVPVSVRGDKCRIRIVKALKNHAFGRVEEIASPSAFRTEPACPAFPRCGGCAFWHMSYEEELRAKGLRVSDALQRIGGFGAMEVAVHPSPKIERYRNKAQFPVGRGQDGKAVFGFYRSRSHDIVPLGDCLIQDRRETAL